MVKTILMVLLVSAAAFAQPASRPDDPLKLTHDKAKRLMLALKLAGIKSTKAASKWTWTVKTISCPLAKDDGEDRLGAFECQVDHKKLTGAAAYALVQGMLDVNLQSDNGGGFTVESLSCVDDLSALDRAEGPYACVMKRAPAPLD